LVRGHVEDLVRHDEMRLGDCKKGRSKNLFLGHTSISKQTLKKLGDIEEEPGVRETTK